MDKKNEKTQAEKLAEKLLSNKKHGGLVLSDDKLKKADKFCEGYKDFLDKAKTEREAVVETIEMAKKNGFEEFVLGKEYKEGDKIYYNNRDKAVILTVIGKKPLCEGIRIAAAHIDSPRLDLKQNPLYEDNEIALFKTHYYGGIKKYQWVAIPLSLHGVIVKADGEIVNVNIGEDKGDPVFCVTDLLPHLATAQMKRTPSELIKGEELNILVGSRPFRDDKASNKVKLNIMAILNEKYGIVEDDFISAELEAVPQFKATDVGFDRSMVGGYGQDDRVCAYPAVQAIFKCKNPKHTCMTVLADKEETGSDGNTGLNSSFLPYFINNLAKTQGFEGYNVMSASECLSADVNAGVDPTFSDVTEERNSSKVNYGVVATKFTGSRGKSGTSDASAEFVGKIRRLFDKNNILWQTGELGKVDMGGGGTVAQYIANLNIDVIDVGVPVLSMHAPFEVTSKIDIFMAYKAFTAFFED